MIKSNVLSVLILIVSSFAFAQAQEPSFKDSYLELNGKVARAEELLEIDYHLEAIDLEFLENLAAETESSMYKDLLEKSLLFLALGRQKQFLQAAETGTSFSPLGAEFFLDERRYRQKLKTRQSEFWIFFGGGLAFLALSSTFWVLGEVVDQQWLRADTIEKALRFDIRSNWYTRLSYTAAGLSVLSFGVSLPFASAVISQP